MLMLLRYVRMFKHTNMLLMNVRRLMNVLIYQSSSLHRLEVFRNNIIYNIHIAAQFIPQKKEANRNACVILCLEL